MCLLMVWIVVETFLFLGNDVELTVQYVSLSFTVVEILESMEPFNSFFFVFCIHLTTLKI